MHRSNPCLGLYHRSLPIVTLNQKDSAVEEQEEEARSPRLSLTAPLAQTSRSIRVHQVSHLQLGPSVLGPTNAGTIATDSHHHQYQHYSNGPSLPSILSLCGDGNAASSIAAAGGRPIVPQHQYYRQPTVAAPPPPPQFSYRNHYQQNPPPPLLPRLSVSYSVGSSNGSSAVSPSTPTYNQQQQPQYGVAGYAGRQQLGVPTLSSPTATTLTSASASPVGGSAYAFGGSKRTHEEMAGTAEHTSTRAAGRAAAARKRSRHAWPAKMTRQIINVLLDEFLTDPAFRTTIYRSRDERDVRFAPSGRTILEEYNKVQNMRRRYFIPLSYLLQWEQLNSGRLAHEAGETDELPSPPAEGPDSALRVRQRCNIEKKLAKPLERSRLQMIFCSAMKGSGDELAAAAGGEYEAAAAAAAAAEEEDDDDDDDADADADDGVLAAGGGDVAANGKPVFELDIFVKELKRRDIQLWARGVNAFHAWVSRKCSIGFIINH